MKSKLTSEIYCKDCEKLTALQDLKKAEAFFYCPICIKKVVRKPNSEVEE